MKRTVRLPIVVLFSSAAAWCKCHGAEYIVSAGIEDHFQGPPKPVTPSLRLSAENGAKGYTKLYGNTRFRRFDEDGANRIFLTSLPLPPRKICSAQFEMRVRRMSDGKPGYDYNDFLLLGFAPFTFVGPRISLFRAGLWAGDPYDLREKTVRIPLPAIEINRFVLLTDAPHFFDIMVHNDTTVDYVKLILRFE